MKTHQKLLTGVLVLLTGMMIGMITMVHFSASNQKEIVEVRVTEIKRSADTINPIGLTDTRFPDMKLIAREVTPAVVFIESTVQSGRNEMPDDPNHSFDENLLDRFLNRRRATTIGSGVIITSDGYILTNNHVIADADPESIVVALNDKRSFNAVIIGKDPSTDLAVIKIDSEQLPHTVIGNSDLLEVGDWVMAIGNPFRLRSTVTAGIVSALGRDVAIINDRMRIEHFIQTDAAINKGNSGGALVNVFGELVGINTAIATENGLSQGYGFAVPANMAIKIARDMIEFGEVRRAYLGVQIVAVSQNRAEQLSMDAIRGVEVMSVARNSAAEKGGLKVRDVILRVDGVEVNEANELQAKIAVLQPGDRVNLVVWRNGEMKTLGLQVTGLEDGFVRNWVQNE